MAPLEIRHHVAGVLNDIRSDYGYVDPKSSAEILGIPKVERVILHHSTRPYLLPGVEDTLRSLLMQGDMVRIWTNDALVRVATSGLGEVLRRELGRSERRRFAVVGYENHKFVSLPSLLHEAEEKEMPVVIVDNSSGNLAEALEIARQQNLSVSILPVWAQILPQERKTNGFSHSYVVITEISQLLRVKRLIDRPAFWLVDFNHTLMDTDTYEDSIVEPVATIVFDAQKASKSTKPYPQITL